MAIFGQQLRITPERETEPQGYLESASSTRGGKSKPGEINLDNILKLIPGEVVSIYLAGKGIAGPAGGQEDSPFWQQHWLAICFWTCLAACFIFRAIATKPVGQTGVLNGINWPIVLTTCLAFFLWAHAVGDQGPVISGFSGSRAGFFAMILGIFAPKLARA